jgi:Fe-S-cluster containining protein
MKNQTNQPKSKLNQIVDKVKSQEFKTLSLDDTFSFDCKICGSCCKNRSDILLNPYDIYRLCKGLNIDTFELFTKYIDVFAGADSQLPLARVKFKSVEFSTLKYTVCPFLRKKDNLFKCTVHEFKPTVCGLYPLGRMQQMEADGTQTELKYFVQNIECDATKDVEHKVSDWLSNFNIQDSEKAFFEWGEFITKVYQLIDFRVVKESKTLTGEIKLKIVEAFMSSYLRLEMDKDFFEQSKENYSRIINIFEQITNELKKLGIKLVKPTKEEASFRI